MPEHYRYQVAVLAPEGSEQPSILQKTLSKRFGELGVSKDSFLFFERSDFYTNNPKSPMVGVYFGSDQRTLEDEAIIDTILKRSAIIIPVVRDKKSYDLQVPEILKPINAMELEEADEEMEKLAGHVLEGLALLRRDRRLFISYKRTEASIVANQLYNLLDSRGFDVFLDTNSILPGDPFQEVLWHRLCDTDVVVLLDSPNFLGSHWTREELARASAMTIGLLQVIWPAHPRAAETELSVPFPLEPESFLEPAGFSNNGGLTNATLQALATEIESLRARSLAARHNNLVREFCDAAKAVNVNTAVQPERFIEAILPCGARIAVIPAIGVPDAIRCEEVSSKFVKNDDEPEFREALIVYDHRGIRDVWRHHLAWLNKHLPVRTLEVTNTESRLRSLC